MNRDLIKRLDRLEARTAPPQQVRFFKIEGPPELSEEAAYAFLQEQGHRWAKHDLVVLNVCQSRDPAAPLRDLTKHQHGVAL